MKPERLRPATIAIAIVAAFIVSLISAGGASAATTTKLSNVTIPASDGVNLVGDVYLPGDGAGRYPAVVDLEPYGRSASTVYVDHGYARVNTDVRGSGMSGGALCLLCMREQKDVADVIEWIARQPWSNGHVALYGYSYSAITALLGAALQPPHLDAVVVGHPPTDPYRDVVWHNGLYDQGFVAQWFAGQTGAQAIGLGPQPQILDRAQQQFAIETRLLPLDGPVYQERSVLAKMSHITVPVYVFSGWEDNYSRGDLRLIDGLASRYKVLYIDASTHHGTGEAGEIGAPYGGSPSQQLGDVQQATTLSAATPNHEDQAWLDRFVKGIQNGIENLPRVRYFDLGDGSWHTAPSWQSVTTRQVSYYLSAAHSGSAPLSPNDGSLANAVPTGRDSYQDSYVYNPLSGVSVPIGREGPDGFLPYAPLDQRVDQPLGLTYTTPVLTAPLPLAGPSELRFWTITEGSDMAYVGRLIDVAPDGSTSLITQGWLRASFRYVDPARSRPGAPYLPDDRQLPVTIGLQTEYRMDIWDTAYTLAPGHRLRLWLSSSDFPDHEPLQVAGRNLILHEADYPSQLLIGTRLPGAAGAASHVSVSCVAPGRLSIGSPRGLHRVRVYLGGRRLHAVRHRGRLVVSLPAGAGRSVSLRIRGVDRRGRAVAIRRRYAVACG
jgi:putative CocE/NonD family hydrolase